MKDKKEIPKTCELMGHQVELDRIASPHLRKAIMKRAGFLFGFGKKKSSGDGPKHADYHTGGGSYSENSRHSDCTHKRLKHRDHTEYQEHKYDDVEPWGA